MDGINKQQFPLRRVVKHNVMVKYVADDLGTILKKTGFQGNLDDWAAMLGVTGENKDTLGYIQLLMQEAMDKLEVIKLSVKHEKRLAVQINSKTTQQSVGDFIKKYEGAGNCPESDTKRRLEVEKETRREENDRNLMNKSSDSNRGGGNNRGSGRGGYKGKNFNPSYQQQTGGANNWGGNNGFQSNPPPPYFNQQTSSQFSNLGRRGGYQGASNQKCHKCGEPWAHGHKCALNTGK
jgi:hypothetical protein